MLLAFLCSGAGVAAQSLPKSSENWTSRSWSVSRLWGRGRSPGAPAGGASGCGDHGYTPLKPFVKVGHRVNGPYRGYKGNVTDGGHRIPLVIRWPGVVNPNRCSDQLVCLSDLMATCAEMLGASLPENAAEDSVSLLPLLRGENRPVREALVHQGGNSNLLVIRRGPWKLALCAGDGAASKVCTEEGVPQDLGEDEAHKLGLPPIQLYNMADDPGETKNLQKEHPEVVKELFELLKKHVEQGRSTPGTPQKNDVPISLPQNRSR